MVKWGQEKGAWKMKKIFSLMMALMLVFGMSIHGTYAKTSRVTATRKTYTKYKKQAKKLGTLKKAQQDVNKKKQAFAAAQQAYNNAVAAYNTNVVNAKSHYDVASNAYEAAGYDFIMNKASAHYYQSSNDAMAADTNLAAYVNGLDESVKSTLSTTNLKRDITLIRELNNDRATDSNFPNSKALGVDYDLMVFASISGFIANSTGDHTYFRNCPEAVRISWAENLAWGLDDPLDGWYTAEKAVYDAGGNGVTGHYTNCVGEYDYIGLTINESTGTSVADFNSARESGTQVSVDEFEAALNSYIAPYETALNSAKATYDQTVADQSAITAAKQTMSSCKNAYTKANDKVKKIKKVNKQLAKAKKAYQKALKASLKKTSRKKRASHRK